MSPARDAAAYPGDWPEIRAGETRVVTGYEAGECRSCGAPVIWTVTHKGKRMPVDADPVENGNIKLRRDGDRVVAEYPGKEHPGLFDDADEARYLSHFATCPNAGDWRRP